jgi:purine-cytosine permease-like protein
MDFALFTSYYFCVMYGVKCYHYYYRRKQSKEAQETPGLVRDKRYSDFWFVTRPVTGFEYNLRGNPSTQSPSSPYSTHVTKLGISSAATPISASSSRSKSTLRAWSTP